MTVAHYFPLDAEYVFKLRFAGVQVDGEETDIDPYQVKVAVKAGLHTIGVTSPRENLEPENDAPAADGAPGGGARAAAQVPSPVDLRLDGARVRRFDVRATRPDITKLVVGGPYAPTGRGDTPSRRAVFVCHPASRAQEPACARTILASLAHRAFRRPVTKDDVQPLYAFYEKARASGDFESGIQSAIEAMLVSPEFLFRIEHDTASAANDGAAHPVNDVELASRLSFFLWSSIPDAELMDLAEHGRLRDSATLERQVGRMLDDPRSDALIAN